MVFDGSGVGNSASVQTKRSRLRAGTALGSIFVAVILTTPAHAQNECGPVGNGTVTCTAAGNPYPNGITYHPLAGLALTTNPDVVIDNTLQVTGAGIQTITNNGKIASSGPGSTGSLVGGVGGGIYASGSGVVISGPGSVSTSGTRATGIYATSNSGSVSVSMGSVAVSGARSYGVLAQTYGAGATASIDIPSVVSSGGGATAVDAYSLHGVAQVTTGTVAAYEARGISAYGGEGASVNSGSVAITGSGLHPGIVAVAVTGDADVNSTGAVTTTGSPASGIIAKANAGVANIVNSGTIGTTGNTAYGIYASGAKGVSISGNGSIKTNGAYADGVSAFSQNGNVTISQGTISTAGDFSPGITAIAPNGSALVSVANIATRGYGSTAIYASGESAQVVISGSVSRADTSTSYRYQRGNAVSVRAGQGTASVVNNGEISVAGSGIAGPVINSGSAGIYASGAGGVVISGRGNVTATGSHSNGIYATSSGGDVSVTAGTVKVSGTGSTGILAQTYGQGSAASIDVTTIIAAGGGDAAQAYAARGIATTTSGTTVGMNTSGLFAIGGSGAVVNSGSVAITGADRHRALVALATNGDATVVATGPTSTTGLQAAAITSQAYTGIATVMNSGAVMTSGSGANGIYANGLKGVVISGAGSVATTGDNSDAISATSSSGGVIVTQGDVSTAGGLARGVVASAPQGNVAVNVGNVSTKSMASGSSASSGASTGILAQSGTGNVSVTAANVATSGDFADGVLASSHSGAAASPSAGAVTVTSTGTVSTMGANAAGIAASAQNGPVTVTINNVSTTGSGAVGVNANSAGGPATVTLKGAASALAAPAALQIVGGTTATLNLAAGGSLTAAGGGAQLTSATGSSVNNVGTIAGGGSAPILTATGGPLTLINTGSFVGVVRFTAGNDTINNSGTYRASFDQDFGAGMDTFNNSGTLLVLPGATTAGTVRFTGLEGFNNTGLVDLRNGHAGDALSTSSSFTGSGGSTLGIDVAFAPAGSTSAADRLTAAGAITGSTTLLINQVGTNGAILNAGTVFATGGAGSSATAFQLAPQARTAGFIRFGIAFDPTTNTYSLVGTPSSAVFRTLKIDEGAQQLWYKSADAWSGHMSELRDAKFAGGGSSGGRVWGEFYGQTDTRDAQQSFSTFGQEQTANLSYRQDAFGGQLGMDLGSAGRNGALVFGVTVGYLNSDLRFQTAADRVNYSTANIGAYASFVSGGLFANVLGKYDYLWIDAKSQSAGYAVKFHGMSYGAQGEAGFRLGGDRLYAEPVATIAYVRTDLNDLHALGDTIDFDKFDGLRGKAGVRIGGKFDVGGGAAAVVYAQGNYVHEFKGRDGIAFTSGGTTLGYDNQRIGNYGEGKIGFSVISANGVTGFLEGFGEDGNSYKGGGGRAGIRARF